MALSQLSISTLGFSKKKFNSFFFQKLQDNEKKKSANNWISIKTNLLPCGLIVKKNLEWVIFCLSVWRGHTNIFLRVAYHDTILSFTRFLGKINKEIYFTWYYFVWLFKVKLACSNDLWFLLGVIKLLCTR